MAFPDGTVKDVSELEDKTAEIEDYINGTLKGVLDGLQGQLDGVIEQWFYAADPSDTTEPTKDWIAGGTSEQEKHLGDLYYNTETGKVWRYVKKTEASSTGKPRDVFKWVELEDTELAKALQLAQDALDAADDKARIFYVTPYAPYDPGDLWVQGTTGDIMVCTKARAAGAVPSFASGEWKKASKYTDDSSLHDFINNQYAGDMADVLNQIDGKIECFYQTTNPANQWPASEYARHVGDQWYNTSTKILYRFIKSSWSQTTGGLWIKPIFVGTNYTGAIEDSTNHVTWGWQKVENADAIAAAQAAAAAQSTADGKRTVFVSEPRAPYYVGDLWLKGIDSAGRATGGIWRCIKENLTKNAFNINEWVEATYYDCTQAVIDGGIVTAGTVQLANEHTGSIVAGITGGYGKTWKETAATPDSEKVRIWAGASEGNRKNAPFRVLQNGKVFATDAEISGTVDAQKGSIGGFEIGQGRIGASSSATSTAGEGLSLYKDFIKFADSGAWVIMGTNVLPASLGGLRALARFTNKETSTYGNNYGLIIDVAEGYYGRAHAITAKGAISSNSFAIGYGISEMTPAANTLLHPGDATKPNPFRILAHFKNSGGGIGFPTRDNVTDFLAITKGSTFAVPFIVIGAADSTQTGFIRGRNTDYNGTMNTNQYAYRLNNNGGTETGKMNLSKGDIAEFMLVYDGTNYYAYLLNNRT